MNGRIEAGYSTALFISLEGIDGAGKTTVAGSLQNEWDDVVVTREPSEMWTGKNVRNALQNEEINPLVDFFLFMSDRKNHIEEIIKPSLDDGCLVVSDRYADSTRAYQRDNLRGHVPSPESYINNVMQPWTFEPDITFYLDVSIETALERMDGEDKYEKEEYLRRVKGNYEDLMQYYGDRMVRIDGEQSKEDVLDDVMDFVKYYCGEAEQTA